MKIHNCLPTLIECLNRWKSCPSEAEFISQYADPLASLTGGFFDDFYDVLKALDWNAYRGSALKLDPSSEEERFKNNLNRVESLFQFKLEGEVFLLGTFHDIDGFARFDRGQHQVFLGLDEGHLKGRYLDVLTTHELTHVARESRAEVWEGFGLDPLMKRADFLEFQPVIEHLMGEGFSCAVSEILVPHEPAWSYAYQTESSLKQVYRNAPEIEKRIKQEIRHPDGDYGRLYGIKPIFAHYVWAWEWVKQVLEKHADQDPKRLVQICSKEFIQDALEFSIQTP